MPARSAPPCHGRVSSSTPAAASAGHSSRRPPRLRGTATVSGPRNSSALAVPSGSRATAAMNSIVTPAVTTPSVTAASRTRRGKRHGRGRTTAASSRPAHASRSHAAPSGPTWPNRWTDSARPSWTHAIEPTAISVPARARDRCGTGMAFTLFSTYIVIIRVHLILVDIPFSGYEQSCDGPAPPGTAARAVPPRLDAGGRRGHARHHLHRLPADRGAGAGGGHAADRAGRAPGTANAGRPAPGRPRGHHPRRTGGRPT